MGAENHEQEGRRDLAAEAGRATEDFQRRTLQEMKGVFNRLIYLASLRDYNTGRYHHYGLESRYSSQAVDQALRQCHEETFEELTNLSLEAQTQDLIAFFELLKEDRARLVEAWRRLRPYRLLPPENCHPLARDLFNKNVEIILNILRATELWPLLHDPHGDPDNLP